MMKSSLIVFAVLLLSLSCKRIVEVEDPAPVEIEYCFAQNATIGDWRTDSVWVITEVDSLDSLIENRQPGIFYELSVDCGAAKELLLTYTGFHGIRTIDVRSSNYETAAGAFFTYDPFDDQQDTSNAGFRMPYQLIGDSLMNCTFHQELGNGQRSDFYLFFKAVR